MGAQFPQLDRLHPPPHRGTHTQHALRALQTYLVGVSIRLWEAAQHFPPSASNCRLHTVLPAHSTRVVHNCVQL